MLKITCAAFAVALATMVTAQAGTIVVKNAAGQLVQVNTVNSKAGCLASAKSLGYTLEQRTGYCNRRMRELGITR